MQAVRVTQRAGRKGKRVQSSEARTGDGVSSWRGLASAGASLRCIQPGRTPGATGVLSVVRRTAGGIIGEPLRREAGRALWLAERGCPGRVGQT